MTATELPLDDDGQELELVGVEWTDPETGEVFEGEAAIEAAAAAGIDLIETQENDSEPAPPPKFPDFEGRHVFKGSASISGQVPVVDRAYRLDEEVLLVARARVIKVTHEDKKRMERKHVPYAGEDVFELTDAAIGAWFDRADMPEVTASGIVTAAQTAAIEAADRAEGRQQLPFADEGTVEQLNREELQARDEDGIREFPEETVEEVLEHVERERPYATIERDEEGWRVRWPEAGEHGEPSEPYERLADAREAAQLVADQFGDDVLTWRRVAAGRYEAELTQDGEA